MKISKRLRASMLAKEEEMKRLNAISPRKPAEIPPFTADDKRSFDRMSAIMQEVIHGMSTDLNLVSELVRLGHRCLPGESSMRLWELQQKIRRYTTLKQEAAKNRLWQEMQSIIYGLETEVSQSRAARERAVAQASSER